MCHTFHIFCTCLAMLFVACDRNSTEAESKSNAGQSSAAELSVEDPLQKAERGTVENEIKPKEWWIFPVGTIDPYHQDWYSRHLVAAKESKIHPDLEHIHYRFTWLRTFHHPFIFHITKGGGEGYTMTVTSLSGKGGYEPGEVSFKKSTQLSETEILELQKQLEEIKFWELPTGAPEEMGLDGAQWILEAVDENKYHVVDRWSAGVLKEVGRWFMRTSKIDVPEEENY